MCNRYSHTCRINLPIDDDQSPPIDKSHGVLAVIPDKARQIHTTRPPQFLGLKPTVGLWHESDYGSDLVVGVLNTGIWPERKTCSDHRLGPIPKHWKGECEEAVGFSKSLCNRKLVGASFFPKEYESMGGGMKTSVEFRSPRDSHGHGTHTTSTATGRYVYKTNMLGYANEITKGMTPKARLAMYKVCWLSSCYDSDILFAFDTVVEDGVDVISLSVGGGVVPYYLDSIEMGAFGVILIVLAFFKLPLIEFICKLFIYLGIIIFILFHSLDYPNRVF